MRNSGDSFDEANARRERETEDAFFARRDAELLARMRTTGNVGAGHHCPECGATLETAREHGVSIERCPSGHGLWLDEDDVRLLARRSNDDWLERYLYRPRRAE